MAIDLPLVLVVILGIVVSLWALRMLVMARGLKAYGEAKTLSRQGALSSDDAARVAKLRARARPWGPAFDPALSPAERLASLPEGRRWMAGRVDGTEAPTDLEHFTDSVLAFSTRHPRGFSPKQFADELVLRFAQRSWDLYYEPLVAEGVRTGEADERARVAAGEVTRHFFMDESDRLIGDPRWRWEPTE